MARRPTAARLSPDFALGRLVDALWPVVPRERRVRVRRPDDLLVFDLLFDNLELERGERGPRLVRGAGGPRALLIAELPPQSFGEEAFQLAEPNLKEPVPPLPSARVRMSGPSRLAFVMPPGETSLPYTLAAVLEAMRTWPLQLAAGALPDPDRPSLRPGDWLVEALASTSVSQAVERLSGALDRAGAEGVASAIEEAGRRVAQRAAGGLAGGAQDALGAVALSAMQTELDDLHRRFPVLREGDAHEAGIAALSLAGARAIAPLAARAQLGEELVAQLPFLPLLLTPHAPSATATAIELPYRLVMSPIEEARWQHGDVPVTHRDRTELWHTRLRTAGGATGRDGTAKVRAVWSPDYPLDVEELSSPDTPLPFRMSLHAKDRQRLVKLMAGYDERQADGRRYRPRSSSARRLHLSALGALLDVEGEWNERPKGVSVGQWRHLAALGRDAYVRVVTVGYLACFGHDAALVKVTERKFESLGAPSGNRVAVLRQRQFIVVRKRVMEYDGAGHVFGGRNFPFRRVEILTKVTPDLVTPGAGASALVPATGDTIYSGGDTTVAFWPMLPTTTPGGSVDFRFEILATDIAGRTQCFSMPLLFVDEVVNQDKDAEVRRAYNLPKTEQRRTAPFGGGTVRFAAFDPVADNGDPDLPTQRMTFAAGALTRHHFDRANFHPETASASVGIRPLQKLLGQPDAVADVAYPQVFKDYGFGESDPSKNKGKLFLQLVGQPHKLEFGGSGPKSDALGALAAPQMTILGLSKVMGPVAGQAPKPADLADPAKIEQALGKVVGGEFHPTDFFSGATILGGVKLSDILAIATDLAKPEVPKLLSREVADGVEASFDWTTTIAKPDPLKLVMPRADGAADSPLTMRGVVTTPIGAAGSATYEATATLGNFKVNLFGFIILWFDELSFAARKGSKPDVAVDLHPTDAVMFGGPLEFVNELRDYIPSNGFSDPPSLAVTPSGIAASYSLTLPTLGVGVFALKNASLGAGFNLPFDATPASVRFNFSERQHPFSLTVSLLGGGGFFAIGISSRGVQEIEAAIEFGAEIAIDLGVASGGVEIKAGVYFHWLEKVPNKGSVELTGYVRLHGELSVLGLISASLTFNLQLGFLKAGGTTKVWGEATLTIEVEVLFISFDVSVTCKKEFDGPDADPKFIEQVPDEPTWDEYCGAFAAEAL